MKRFQIIQILPRSRIQWIRAFCVALLPLLVILCGGLFMSAMPGRSFRGDLPPLEEDEVQLKARLKVHVEMLATEIGQRNWLHPENLKSTEAYLENQFRQFGYEIKIQTYTTKDITFANIEAEQLGRDRPDEILLIGAHYDTVPGSPGANDNGSAVAALLECANLLRDRPLSRTVRFVAFANEEPPFFMTDQMGSWVYARQCRKNDESIVGMIALETIGYYSDAPGSQKYPFPLGWFYPNTGNFLAFVGNLKSRSLLRQSIASFRSHTRFPSEGVTAPEFITGIGWSDHWAFWQEGYPAIMVTDTALFRYPWYHAAQDTPDKLDYGRLARVTRGMVRVIEELAGHPESE